MKVSATRGLACRNNAGVEELITVSATRGLLLKPLVRCLRGYRMWRARTAAPAHHWAAFAVRSIALAEPSIGRGSLEDVNAGRPVGAPLQCALGAT